MALTNNEIRDITRLLEQGKPLPDYYRFLMSEEKREAELIWNGKTNEVCNVVMPFQTIEQVDEPRAEKEMKLQPDLFDTSTGRQLKGWEIADRRAQAIPHRVDSSRPLLIQC